MQKYRGIKIDVKQREDLCNPSNRHYQIYSALIFMDSLQFSGKAPPRSFNHEIVGYHWFDWFKNRAQKISWGPDHEHSDGKLGKPCDGMANAFSRLSGHTFYLCPNVFPDEFNERRLVDLVVVLMHEARHLDGKDHTAPCHPSDDFKICDPDIEFEGAFAVSVEVESKIGMMAVNVSDETKRYAKERAASDAVSGFSRPPFKQFTEPVLLLRGADGRNFIFNSQLKRGLLDSLPPGKIGLLGLDSLFVLPENHQQALSITLRNTTLPLENFIAPFNYGWPLFEAQTSILWSDFADAYFGAGRINAIASGNIVRFYIPTGLISKPKVIETTLPEGKPLFIRGTIDGAEIAAVNIFYVVNDKDQLFQLQITGDKVSAREVKNPY
ncbi:MAG: hypothetical protein ACXVA9_11900, partial [Bdellovibrionales bacterium]